MFDAQRPVIIFGSGVRLAGAEKEALEFAELTGIPVSPTWGGLDLVPYEHPLFIGSHGTHGTRFGNFALANADLILAIGCRLDSKTTGTPTSTFARQAKIVMVDIDQTEIDKFKHMGLKVKGYCEDLKTFLTRKYVPAKYPEWYAQIEVWKRNYPICQPEYYKEKEVNPYVLVKELSRIMREGDILVTDTGCSVAWLSQAFEFKTGQRFIHAWNQTPMGYGLPAAIGAHYATGKRVVLVSGDGSFQMQNELATVAGHKLPIKILLMNNKGHAMCRQTQREWFDKKYESTSIEGGLTFPSFAAVSAAHGIGSFVLKHNNTIEAALEMMFENDDPILYDVKINPEHDVIPKLHASKPIEDMQPYLPRDEFLKCMIVPALISEEEKRSWQNANE